MQSVYINDNFFIDKSSKDSYQDILSNSLDIDKYLSNKKINAFLNKYQILHNDLLFSKIHFLDQDQQMYTLHCYYSNNLSCKVPSWNKINILFHNELEAKLTKLCNKSINYASLTKSYLLPLDEYKLIHNVPILSILLYLKSTNYFIFANTINEDIDLLNEYPDKFNKPIFNRNKIFTLELPNYWLHILVDKKIVISIHSEDKLIFYKEVNSINDLSIDELLVLSDFQNLNKNYINSRLIIFLKLME